MATYESIIKIKGAVGDLVFYTLNGKNVVRKKSGFNKTAFTKNPSYEKVRQNSTEFGHCSRMGKALRSCLSSYIKEAGDPLLYQKFARLMTSVKDLDLTSERGKRTVGNGLKTEQGKKLLKEFQFGNVKNIVPEVRIEAQTLYTNHYHTVTNNITLVIIKPDFENYRMEFVEETFPLASGQSVSLKPGFSKDDFLLYFMVIKKEDGSITHMGFI
ncbi:hypothetical protein [Chryseobacterium gallinarum]|uniref:DUF4238 domain-containing protein n=1 Tax=Chryseobacterium gallinarum TaxID=1324352 RepID=A0ABX6KNE0_CHRGL|nr:hypothetical protein [Chryseobacterium gallinarum]QIY89967.1 hypothetical protein FOB44_04525 [Chryseobacterium gallinarum]